MPGTLTIPSAQVSPDGPFKVETGKYYAFSTVVTDLDFVQKFDNEAKGNVQRKYAVEFFEDLGWMPYLYLWMQTGEPRIAWPKEDLPYALGAPDVVPVLRGSALWQGPPTILDRDYFANGLLLWVGVWPVKPRSPGDPIIPATGPIPTGPGPWQGPEWPGPAPAPAPNPPAITTSSSAGLGAATVLGVIALTGIAALWASNHLKKAY